MVRRSLLASLLGAGAVSLGAQGKAQSRVQIEAMQHDIQQITMSNFDGIIAKFRDSSASSVWFFKDDHPEDIKFLDEYNKVAKDLKGMAKVTAISCTDWPAFCTKHSVTETPTVMVFPPNPMPAFKHEGKMESKAILGGIARHIPDFAVALTKDNIESFLTKDSTKPKALLFSNKKKPPTIWKALSSETVFKRTVKFGFVAEDDKELMERFKVKKSPAVIMQRGGQVGKHETYTGDLAFTPLKDWVNLHSESGMGDKTHGGGAGGAEEDIEESQPWLVQAVPELTSKSHKDVCFKGDGLCVIYLSDGPISTAETDMLTDMSKKYTSQLSDRGTKMKWMWIDLKVEAEYKTLFDPAMLPSAVVFNPHKRLRFTKLDHGEEMQVKGDERGITNLLEKVLGGDARFTMVKGQKLPAWAVREDGKKQKKTEL